MMRSRKKIKSYLKTNESDNILTQNLWETAKAVLRRKLSNTSLTQESKKTQINNLTLHLNKLEKYQQSPK